MLRDKLMWGVFLTFYMKSYLKLYVNSALGVVEEGKTQTERLVPFIILFLLSFSPIFVLAGLMNMRNDFDKPETKIKYGALTMNIRTDAPQGYIFNYLYIIRRMIYGLSLAFLGSSPTS